MTVVALKDIIKDKLAFGQHPEYPSLMVLQVKSYGVWYDVPGTTVHSTDDKGKVAIIEKYANAIGLTD